VVEDIPPEGIGFRSLSDYSDAAEEELPGFRGPLHRPEAAEPATEPADEADTAEQPAEAETDDVESPVEDGSDG
jgi:hypothetical protein